MVTNRIGDIGYLMAICYLTQVGSTIGCCLAVLLAAATKRSQYPFSSWLPAAIAAPTPVSRLVHSSTLVTAGIFIILRLGFGGFTILSLIGLITMVGGGLVALLGQDAKKIVALSTLSQLGLITYSLSSCSEVLTLFHLLVHAYFKRLLFICVGVLIHRTFGTQESRMGSDGSSPRGSLLLGLSSVTRIRGLVATSGAGSKHQLLERLGRSGGFISLAFLVIGRGFTVLYRGKLVRVLTRVRSGRRASGCSGVDVWGVAPLLMRVALGIMFFLCSPIVVGLISTHIPSSPFFLVFVVLLIVIGYLIGAKIDRPVWATLIVSAGSGSRVVSPLSSHVTGDVAA